MAQLPLPKNIDTQQVLSSIALSKDVDGLNPMQSRYHPTFTPCTPMAIMQLLDHYKIALRHQRDLDRHIQTDWQAADGLLFRPRRYIKHVLSVDTASNHTQ